MQGSLALVGLAVLSLIIARDYGLWSFGSPGAGLMPALGAAILLVASLGAAREKSEPRFDGGSEAGVFRYGIGLLALLPGTWLIGMVPALGLFILALLLIEERMKWPAAFAIAGASVVGSWLLFEKLLQVPLPKSAIW